VALRPINANRLYTDELSMEKGEIIEENVKGEKNRKVRKIEAVLLLCLTSILQPVRFGRP